MCVCVCVYILHASNEKLGRAGYEVSVCYRGRFHCRTTDWSYSQKSFGDIYEYVDRNQEPKSEFSLQLPDNSTRPWSTIYIVTCLWLERDRAYQTSVVRLACLCPGGGMMGTSPIKTINAQTLLHQSVSFTEDPPPPSGKPTSRFQGFCS